LDAATRVHERHLCDETPLSCPAARTFASLDRLSTADSACAVYDGEQSAGVVIPHGNCTMASVRAVRETAADRRRVVSFVQWAGIVGLADDGRSLSTARRVLTEGEGPKVVKVGRRAGVQLDDHVRWARSKPWAKYLAASAAPEGEKRLRKSKQRSK
jgi:hypothetical protein